MAQEPGASPSAAGPRFESRELRIGGRTHAYRVWLPPGWDARQRWPVILFLHGISQRGGDGAAPTTGGLGPALQSDPSRFPAVVVFPQCPSGRFWIQSDALDIAWKALQQSIEDFSGDPDRIVLTGISMGGFGVWELALRHPKAFAALVPICGGLVRPSVDLEREKDVARRLKALPSWVFHGADDTVVPVEASRRMVSALRSAGADVRYTEYPQAGHRAWVPAYGDPGLATWILSQRRR